MDEPNIQLSHQETLDRFVWPSQPRFSPSDEMSSSYVPEPGSSDPCIVIVDDNEADLFFTSMLLRQQGFSNVKQFLSGPEMMRAVGDGLECDVLLIDIRMPEMDGFATLDALSDVDGWIVQHPAVFMVSAASNADDVDRARANPDIRKLVRKPLSGKMLADMVGEA